VSANTVNNFEKNIGILCAYIFLIIIGLASLFPFVWVFLSSFKTTSEILGKAISLPEHFSFHNYIKAFNTTNITRAFLNSMMISATSVIFHSIIITLAAYATARFKNRFTKSVNLYISLGILIPLNCAIYPILLIMKGVNLDNSLLGLIILYTGLGIPVPYLIMRSYIFTIPASLDESAKIDGASQFTIFFHIILPLSQNCLITVLIIHFIFVWNEFLYAFLLIRTRDLRTLQVSLQFFMSDFMYDLGGLFAAMMIAVLPAIIMFLFFQEKVISGLTAGAIKG